MITSIRRPSHEQFQCIRQTRLLGPLEIRKKEPEVGLDKVQVKYEMLRAHAIDGLSATVSAERHGYSRAAFYLITTAFAHAGMRGLLDEPRGRRGPFKLTAEMMEFVASADATLSGSQLASEVAARFGVTLHRRTIERARR
jgi:hypothetical protein